MKSSEKKKFIATLSAIGIVYGDLGTSPLYAFREALKGLPVTPDNVLGILSLIFWTLIILISIKYLAFVLNADNEGEGGILAMLALIKKSSKNAFKLFFGTAVFGTALLIGDGMITPAISVTSAIEGLNVVSPAFASLTMPITIIILIILYLCQHYGTAKISNLFAPIMMVWFLTIGLLGASHIFDNTLIFDALNPYYGVKFFIDNGWNGYAVLGGVFLVVTGSEALYADLGQFGKSAIRAGWYVLVFPCLLLNYFGQGAFILVNPAAISNPFYSLAPAWFFYPLLLIATLATIIASQAVISATFSITKQAILLDLYPKVPIVQTSSKEKGQVYIPQMNIFLALGTLFFVLTFKTSSAMAHAYGIAVNLEMICVTLIMMYVAHKIWKWSYLKIMLLFVMFSVLELSFLGSNLFKVLTGGWVPILFAILSVILMTTWHEGMKYLKTIFYQRKGSLQENIARFSVEKLKFLPDKVAIFICEPYDESAANLLEYFKLNGAIPETILIVKINIKNEPHVSSSNRYELTKLHKHVYCLIIHIGFMQVINIPTTLAVAKKNNVFPFNLDFKQVTYLVEITYISATERKSTLPFFWQEKLFAFLMHNSSIGIEFYHLPYNRTIAIGSYCEF
ncbi:MAG: KUP/HAK/KT family potassium transporter [Proteobacteria bacterium]|nr:KUP/HAK/KT family potassium transporter [Pseudomonadota bacterium]